MSKKTKNNALNITDNLQKQPHGFSIPENYFTAIEDQLFTKITENNLPKESGFSMPKQYLNTLDQAIFSQIDFPKKETKVISLRSRLFTYVPTAAAACVLLFFGLNYFTFTNANSFENVSSEDIVTWVDESYIDITEFNNQFVDADFTANALLDESISFSENDIYEYLNTTNDDTIFTEIDF